METANSIIERLIDEDKISGKEAFILIEAITKNNNYITNTPSTGISTYPYKPFEVWCSTTN